MSRRLRRIVARNKKNRAVAGGSEECFADEEVGGGANELLLSRAINRDGKQVEQAAPLRVVEEKGRRVVQLRRLVFESKQFLGEQRLNKRLGGLAGKIRLLQLRKDFPSPLRVEHLGVTSGTLFRPEN